MPIVDMVEKKCPTYQRTKNKNHHKTLHGTFVEPKDNEDNIDTWTQDADSDKKNGCYSLYENKIHAVVRLFDNDQALVVEAFMAIPLMTRSVA